MIETDEGLAIPLDGRPSTHIRKLPNPDYKGLVENEALVLSLARAVGLPLVDADGHAKNVSILRTMEGRHALAPFYDLVCTGAYDFDHRMAMSVGGQFDPGAVNKKPWVRFASDIGIGKSLVLRTVAEMANRVPAVLDEEMTTLEDRLGQIPRRQQVEGTIKDRVRRSLEILG